VPVLFDAVAIQPAELFDRSQNVGKLAGIWPSWMQSLYLLQPYRWVQFLVSSFILVILVAHPSSSTGCRPWSLTFTYFLADHGAVWIMIPVL